LAADLVAAGLYESDQFYPSQFMTYGVEDIDDARPVATTSLRGQVSTVSGKIVRTVLPLKDGARDTINIVFDQKITTPPTVTANPPTAGAVGTVTTVGTTGKSFYVAFLANASYTGDVVFTIKDATSGEAAPLAGLVQTTKTQSIAVDNLAPQKISFTTGVIGKGQSATITLKFNEALGKAPKISVAPGTTGIDGVTGVNTTLSADGLTATYVYEYKDLDGNATHGNAVVTVDNTAANKATDRAGNAIADIAGPDDNLVIDLGPATAPTVTLDGAQYDWGTQIKWALSSAASPAAGGAKSGSIYYVAQTAGDAPPTGFVGGDVPAFILATGVTAKQTGSVAVGSSGNSGSVFSAFTPNGTLDVYVVHLSSTGVISAISAKTVVTMN